MDDFVTTWIAAHGAILTALVAVALLRKWIGA